LDSAMMVSVAPATSIVTLADSAMRRRLHWKDVAVACPCRKTGVCRAEPFRS
jgi:hypothetical protein